jgi:hypothetical protein
MELQRGPRGMEASRLKIALRINIEFFAMPFLPNQSLLTISSVSAKTEITHQLTEYLGDDE